MRHKYPVSVSRANVKTDVYFSIVYRKFMDNLDKCEYLDKTCFAKVMEYKRACRKKLCKWREPCLRCADFLLQCFLQDLREINAQFHRLCIQPCGKRDGPLDGFGNALHTD